MIVGYDPVRVAALVQLSRAALGGLDSISSSDAAADEAMWSLRRLHRSIETGVLAAAEDLVRSAPLTRSFGGRAPDAVRVVRARRDADPVGSASPTSGGTIADLAYDLAIERLTRELGLGDLGDDELIGFAGEPILRSLTSFVMPDFDDPRTTDVNTAIAREFQRRAATDPSFVGLLAAASVTNPLVAFVATHGRWSTSTTIDLFRAALADEPTDAEFDIVRMRLSERLLPDLTSDAESALLAVSSSDLMTDLLVLRERLGIDDAEIARLVDAAFSADSIHDVDLRGPEAARLVRSLIEVMNSPAGERGLPNTISLSYTAGIVPLLPHMIGGFDGRESFFLARHDATIVPVKIADETGDVIDLLGGLARNLESLGLLVASIPVLAGTLGFDTDRPPLYTADELAGFAVLLGRSTANEQAEEVLFEQRREEVWDRPIAMLETVVLASGAIPRPALPAVSAGFDATRWLIDELIAADDLDLDDVPRVVETLLTFGIATQVVSLWSASDHERSGRHGGQRDQADDALARVRVAVAETHALIESEADTDEIRARLAAARNEVEHLLRGGQDLTDRERIRIAELWDALDHPAFDQPPFRSSADTDLDT